MTNIRRKNSFDPWREEEKRWWISSHISHYYVSSMDLKEGEQSAEHRHTSILFVYIVYSRYIQ